MAEEHLRFGGSSAHRWMRCAGSVSLLETIPPKKQSSSMAAGTRAHALLEYAIQNKTGNVEHFSGKALHDGEPLFEPDDVRAVQTALDYIWARLSEATPNSVESEKMYRLLPDTGGTADCVIMLGTPYIDDCVLEIVDYKHGSGVYVPIEDNEQLLLYAASVLRTIRALEWDKEDQYVCAAVRTTIIQPRCHSGDPIRSADYTVQQVEEFAEKAIAARNAAAVPNPVFTPGEHCHSPFRCEAADICPALMKMIAAPDPNIVPLEPDDSDIVFRFADPARARDNVPALAASLSALPLIKAWIKAVEDTAYQTALAGTAIPGYKLVAKRASRKWDNEETARQWLLENTWLSEDEVTPRKLESVAQIETKLKISGQKDTIKAMAHHVNRESSGYNLVPENEKGEAINPTELASASGGGDMQVLTALLSLPVQAEAAICRS